MIKCSLKLNGVIKIMKRVTYISQATSHVNADTLSEITRISQANNKEKNITGVLLFFKNIFFQVIEGEAAIIDALYQKILNDPRHDHITCLKTELNIEQRLFRDWNMKVIDLNAENGIVLQPVKQLLHSVTESHRVLEHYTQPSVVRIINEGRNPLECTPRIVPKIILFADIVSFSVFAEKLPVHSVMEVVNCYLDICTRHITDCGGEVMKFIGDCVMASFPQNKADGAIQAGFMILNELARLRADPNPNTRLLQHLYTGIGISAGDVIEGNIGSAKKMEYTLLGDAVNVAARLQELSREIPHALLFTREVMILSSNGQWPFLSLGSHTIKGKAKKLDIFSINNPIVFKSENGKKEADKIKTALDRLKNVL
jgi:adenylate cyclase